MHLVGAVFMWYSHFNKGAFLMSKLFYSSKTEYQKDRNTMHPKVKDLIENFDLKRTPSKFL